MAADELGAGEAIISGDSHTIGVNGQTNGINGHTNGTSGHTNGTASGTNGNISPKKSKTGITVLIMGAGFGGLYAAIESHRQGHTVQLLESFKELKVLGDIMKFGSNAGRIFRRWHTSEGTRISDRLRPLSIGLRNYGFNIHKYDPGDIVMNQRTLEGDPEPPVFNGNRGEFHSVVFNYVKDALETRIRLGCRVEKYFETATEAGIELDTGERVTVDVVIGAGGVRSKARESVLGCVDKPKCSEYAVFRAWFENKDMLADPETRQFCENGDTLTGGSGLMCISSAPLSRVGRTAVGWHKADWDKVKQDPKSIGFPREDCIHGHDAEKHAESVIAEELMKFS